MISSLLLGLVVGYYARTMKAFLVELYIKIAPKPKVGVVDPDALQPVYSSQSRKVVDSKTPQQIESEIVERVRRAR